MTTTQPRRSEWLIWIAAAVLTVVAVVAAGLRERSRELDPGEYRAAAFLENFRGPERSADDTYSFQWSRAESVIELPRPTVGDVRIVTLRIVQRVEAPPRATALLLGAAAVLLPDQPGSARIYRVLSNQSDRIGLRSDLSGLSGDAATLGVAVDWVRLDVLRPGLLPTSLLIAAAAGLALAAGVAAHLMQISTRDQWWLAGGLVALVGWLAWHHLPELLRWLPAVTWPAPLLSLAALLLRRLVRPLLGGHADTFAGGALLWLLFAASGILYPGFVPTDINFHANRLQLALGGNLYLSAEGQGQSYPYPAGTYLLTAPLTVWCSEPRWCLQWIGLAATLATPLLLGWYLVRQQAAARVIRLALLIGLVLPAGFLLNTQAPLAQNLGGLMSTAWLLLLFDRVGRAEQTGTPISRRAWLQLFGLGCVVLVMHFGVMLNMLLLTALTALLVPRLVWRQRAVAASWAAALLAGFAAVYSVYLPQMAAQLGNLTRDEPVSRWFLLSRYIFDLALYGHYRVVFVAAAAAGWVLLYRRRRVLSGGERGLLYWSGAMLLTSALLMAAFVLADFNATRYAIFMYPAVTVLSALWLDQVSRTAAAGPVLKLLLAATFASTLLQWFSVVALQARNGFLR